MSVGEALVHGLLGGTIGASEHYVTDWKDRVKRARDKTEREQEWQQRELEAKVERDFRAGEAKKERDYQTKERLAGQTYQTSERKDKQKYESEGMQFGYDEKTDRLFTIKPGEESFAPVVAEIKHGEFEYKGSGTTGRGLLSGGRGGSSSKNSPYQDITTPATSSLGKDRVNTIFTDDKGKEWQYTLDQSGNLTKIPVLASSERPTVYTLQQQLDAQKDASGTVNDMARMPNWLGFLTDPKDFAKWGGSRTAAEKYFMQNYLKGHAFNDQGELVLPGSNQPNQPTSPESTQTTLPNTSSDDAAIQSMFSQLSQNDQNMLQKALQAIHVDKKEPQIIYQRLLDYGFTKEQLDTLF